MVDFNFDPTSDRESTGFEIITESGPFAAHIVNVEEKQTNGAKGIGTMFSFTWEIIEGEFVGAKIFQNLNLDNPSAVAVKTAQNDLRDICNAIGHREGFRGDAREALSVLMHRPVRITLGVKSYEKNGEQKQSNEIAREGKFGPLFVYPYSAAPQPQTTPQRQAAQHQATTRPAGAPAGAQSLKKPDFMLRKEAADRAAEQSGEQIPF